jgi:NPCBM/NEW2 domain
MTTPRRRQGLRVFAWLCIILLGGAAAWAAAGQATAPAGAPWTLVTADFQSKPVKLLAMDEQGVRLAASSPAGSTTVAWNDLLELDHRTPKSPTAATNPAGFTLYLNGGDAVGGKPLSIANDTVAWNQPLLGRMEFSEDRVNAIVRGKPFIADLDQPRNVDEVRLANGDSVSGVVQGLSDSTVSIQPADLPSPARINLNAVSAILLADPDPRAASPGRALRVWLADGSCLTVPLARLPGSDAAELRIGFNQKQTFTVALADVSRIEQLGGPVRWLTSLTPLQVIYHPYLDENFPPQFDHPVDDPAVSIRNRYPAFHHGIGVHCFTQLNYAVPPGFSTFRTQFAVDLNVRILLDGKPAAQFPHVHYGPVAAPVILDVKGAKTLSLVVDFGDDLGAQGRFVWLDPAFVAASDK